MDGAEVSRRLKAARWLAGGVDAKGKPIPLSPRKLAQHERLQRNGISANAIEEFEQLRREPREMELRVITEALELPSTWFSGAVTDPVADRLQAIEQLLREHMDDTRQAVKDIERIAADAQLLDAIRQAAQALGARAPADGEPGADLPKPGDERSQA